jgi:UDP-glucose-4-epimerase GalE
MNVLITGGAGYIGSHTAKLLKSRGLTPVVFDDLSQGRLAWARFGPFVFGDIRDEEALFRVLEGFRIEAVIHFAARASVEESTRLPEVYFDVNVGGTVALLKAMKRAEVRRLVFSSSAAVYGDARVDTIAEDHPKKPTNPYGLSKWQCEQVVSSVAPVAGIRYAVLRYFNVVGNDPEGELYETHEPETHVLPNLMRAALAGGSFTLYGTNHPTADGTAVRDYVYVMDLALAHVRALEVLNTRERLVSNVGGGSGVSVRELLAVVGEALGRPISVVERPIRAGDPPRLVADDRFLRTWFSHRFKPLSEVVPEMAQNPPYFLVPERSDRP